MNLKEKGSVEKGKVKRKKNGLEVWKMEELEWKRSGL